MEHSAYTYDCSLLCLKCPISCITVLQHNFQFVHYNNSLTLYGPMFNILTNTRLEWQVSWMLKWYTYFFFILTKIQSLHDLKYPPVPKICIIKTNLCNCAHNCIVYVCCTFPSLSIPLMLVVVLSNMGKR